MDEKDIERLFLEAVNYALIIVQKESPYRTGNLSRSFRLRKVDNGYEIFTNTDYMPYTTERWISPRWRGRENPNLDWFKITTELIAQFMARYMGGIYVSNW